MSSRFSPNRAFISTSGSGLTENNYFDLAGLNLYAPDELMKETESPYARNFRIFQDDDLESRVAVSKRKGNTFYTTPVGETNRGEITSTTDTADKAITVIGRYAQKFTVSAAGRLSKVQLNLKNDNSGTAPLIVCIYSDVSSAPGALLAKSSILSSSILATYSYIDATFIEAPVVATATNYWIVVYQQSEATGDYKISSNTSATTAVVSADSGNTWTATSYALNYKVFVSTDTAIKGIYRYYRSSASPVTLFVSGTVLYSVNDLTGATTSVGTGLSATAPYYRFITVEDICYFVNATDVVQKFDGTTMSVMGGSPGVGIDITLHKNLIFILDAYNMVKWSIEDNSSWEIFESDAIQYIPSPKTADKAFAMFPFQDNLVFFTRNTKWVLYGYDRATFQLRESTSTKGTVSINTVWREESTLYFLADDNDIYSYNGGTDVSIGIKVTRLIEQIADKSKANLIFHNGILRLYYAPSGEAYNKNCLMYDTLYKQWMHDTEIYTGIPAVFNSQSDDNVLVHGSSLVSRIMYAETGTSDMGKPILFDYWTKYLSYGHPSRKHRIKRLYPFIRPGDGPYYCTVSISIDNTITPSSTQVYMGTDASTWGGGDTWGGSTSWGGGMLEPVRISIPGQARKHQIRYSQHGVDNMIKILGHSTYTKMRRPI